MNECAAQVRLAVQMTNEMRHRTSPLPRPVWERKAGQGEGEGTWGESEGPRAKVKGLERK